MRCFIVEMQSHKNLKMRILYITLENLSFHKGSVVHAKEIVNGLRELGHQVGLVACSLKKSEGEKHFYNLNIIPSFMLRLLRLKKQPHIVSLFILFFTLIRILSQYDILYVREFHAVMIAFLPRLLFEKKLIFEINGLASEEQLLKGDSPLKRFSASLIKQAEKMAAKCSDRIVSVTLQIASYLIQYVHCQPDKVEVISNGVNTHKFHPIHEQSLLMPYRDRVKINRWYKVLAFVGNLARWQGVNILIESGCRLLLRDKKLRFLIVGDGPLKKNLMDRVLESGFQKEFIFTGMVDYN